MLATTARDCAPHNTPLQPVSCATFTAGPLPLYPLGCFADLEVPKELMLASDPTWYVDRDFSSSHAFPYVLPDYSSMTIEKCAALASKAGSPYFGVEKGAECWWVSVHSSH